MNLQIFNDLLKVVEYTREWVHDRGECDSDQHCVEVICLAVVEHFEVQLAREREDATLREAVKAAASEVLGCSPFMAPDRPSNDDYSGVD